MSEKKGKISLAGLTKGRGSSNLSFRFSPESEEIEEILQDNPSSHGSQGCSESAPASPKPSPGDVSPLKEYFIKEKHKWSHKWDKKSMSLDLDLKGKLFNAIEDKKKSILSNFIPEEGGVITSSQSIPENIKVFSGVSDETYQYQSTLTSTSSSYQGAVIKEGFYNEFGSVEDFEVMKDSKSESPAPEVEEVGIDMTNFVSNASSIQDLDDSALEFFVAPEALQELFGGLPTLYQPTNIISGVRRTPLEHGPEEEEAGVKAESPTAVPSRESELPSVVTNEKLDLTVTTLLVEIMGGVVYHPWSKYWIALVAGLLLLPLGPLVGFFLFILGGLTVSIIGRGLTGADNPTEKTSSSSSSSTRASSFPPVEPICKQLTLPIKSQGWMTEMEGDYDVETCHLRQTRVVFVRLDGCSMYLSYPHQKHRIPKRRLWNDPVIDMNHIFFRHRVYTISGAKVSIVPDGLAKKRVWNKKYPIAITFPKYSVFSKVTPDPSLDSLLVGDPPASSNTSENTTVNYNVNSSGVSVTKQNDAPALSKIVQKSLARLDCGEQSVFLFARCDREKDDWYRRLVAASKMGTAGPTYYQKSPPNPLTVYETYMKRACPALIPFFHTMTNSEGWDTVSIPGDLAGGNSKSDNNSKDTPSSSKKSTPEKEKPSMSKNESIQSDLEHITTIQQSPAFLNGLISRLFYDFLKSPYWTDKIAQEVINKKLHFMKKPPFIEEIKVKQLDMGSSVPTIERASAPLLDFQGLWIDLDISYEGVFTVALETHVNLLKLKKVYQDPEDPAGGKGSHNDSAGGSNGSSSPSSTRSNKTVSSPHKSRPTELKRSHIFDSDADDSGESSEEELDLELEAAPIIPDVDPNNAQTKGQKFSLYLSKFASSAIMNTGYVKKVVDNLANTPIVLSVELKKCVGTLAINIPPPPNDRIWLGFRTNPTMEIVAKPKFGDRTFNLTPVTDWIKKKILLEFQRVAVCPNMNDITIPLMEFELPK